MLASAAACFKSLAIQPANWLILLLVRKLSTPCSRIVVLDGGEVGEVGRHDDLLKRAGGIYCRLHELQFAAQEQNA